MKKKTGIRDLYKNSIYTDKILCTNEYGFTMETFTPTDALTNSNLKYKWYNLLVKYKDDGEKIRKSKRAGKLVCKGVPLSLKQKIWKLLIFTPFEYDYNELKSRKCGYEHQIHVDIQRTFRKHFLFVDAYSKGQCELFNILVAYANHRPSIGYCQGMSSFVGLLLMYFPEVEAFEMLVNILQKNNLETLFDKNLSKIYIINEVQTEIFQIAIPEIYLHLKSESIDFSVYAVSWYLTLFTRFDIKLVLHMWDCFLFKGFAVFLFFAAAILRHFTNKILELRGEKLIEFIGRLDSEAIDSNAIVEFTVYFMENCNYYDFQEKLRSI